MEVKRRLLPEIIEKRVVLAFDHDTQMPLARVTKDGKQIIATPVS
jgi:hypothetical protein